MTLWAATDLSKHSGGSVMVVLPRCGDVTVVCDRIIIMLILSLEVMMIHFFSSSDHLIFPP